jgi:dipeptidase D
MVLTICKAISDYCVDFAKKRGLFVAQDSCFNVVIKKEASPSCVAKSPLILQGHLDMVCQKTADSNFDLTKIRWNFVWMVICLCEEYDPGRR